MHPFKLYGDSFTKTKMGNNQCDDIRSTLLPCLDPKNIWGKMWEKKKIEEKVEKVKK